MAGRSRGGFVRHQVEEAFRVLAKHDGKLRKRRMMRLAQASGRALKP